MLPRCRPRDRLEALYVLSLATGLRQSETLGLKWEDIDIDAGLVHVRRALSRVGRQYVLSEVKTAKSRRTVPLAPPTVEALREHRHRQNV